MKKKDSKSKESASDPKANFVDEGKWKVYTIAIIIRTMERENIATSRTN